MPKPTKEDLSKQLVTYHGWKMKRLAENMLEVDLGNMLLFFHDEDEFLSEYRCSRNFDRIRNRISFNSIYELKMKLDMMQ